MADDIQTVVVVDDHSLVRTQIRGLLEAHGGLRVLAESGDGLEAVELIERLEPDLVLLDISLPGLNGLEIAEHIDRRRLRTRVLMLSLHQSPDRVSRALCAGAVGYLVKDSVVAELGPALAAIRQGEVFVSDRLAPVASTGRPSGAG